MGGGRQAANALAAVLREDPKFWRVSGSPRPSGGAAGAGAVVVV